MADIDHYRIDVSFVPICCKSRRLLMGGRPFRYERPALIRQP
jgi:hypothetical protein